FDEPTRTVHHLLERLRGRQTREHDVRLRADLGRRAGGSAADLLEFGERAAAIAQDSIAALDQVFSDRLPDLAHADETDGFHMLAPYLDGCGVTPMPARATGRKS